MRLPTQLSYERSIEPTHVTFHVIWPEGRKKPLTYSANKQLGMKEGFTSAYKDNGEIDEKVTEYSLALGNIHELDYCCVPHGAESIECEFSVSFVSSHQKPFICSDPKVKSTLIKLVKLYEQKIGWEELATRYFMNICNGRWLWKNKKLPYSFSISVKPWPWDNEEAIITFDDIRKNYGDANNFKAHQHWGALIKLITDAFSQPNGLCKFEVSATLRYAKSDPLFPSLAFKNSVKGEKSRIYQTTEVDGVRSPILGSYKTGAAIATIDDWYPNAEEPLRISHYGVHKQDVYSYRFPNTGKDIFTLLERADEYVDQLEAADELSQETINDLHFIIANLIKGSPLQRKGS
ncbi:CRISPR-associated protein Csy3 [Allocatenococcus thiocycli]|uniref:type I-F CRISPR-associated protein Csy3 n=1 Tax=Vibrio sp. EA2 TaxID=3079860 RepID=UPI001F9E3865|nr:type I-F CRISPR-associated protein Csy3 [Vibrio sp. EA2]MDV6254034.1 type I-F CRISPR-associated protein Csy3 [Vibrio sp. EA2]CAH0531725.1 CRISPR-associated protein Csy3 [Catenococcus thiocycli]